MENTRKIIHIDMDCFFAAVEIRDNPSLKGKPVAVGGNPEGRGVLTTANYEAREHGVKSAMPTSHALRLCPELILTPVNFDKYKAESSKVKAIFDKYSKHVQPLSLDEAYLDVTDSTECEGSATLLAQKIRQEIYNTTRLTASAGIAPNKFLAKVASDWRKPNGQFTIRPKDIEVFMPRLPIEKIPGVGKVTAKKMHEYGIFTCKDLQELSIEDLSYKFGTWGCQLYDTCRGVDDRPVMVGGERKSLTVENTYSKDLESFEECAEKIESLYSNFLQRLDRARCRNKVKALVVKIKFHDFESTTLECAMENNLSKKTYLEMIDKAYQRGNKPVRLIGLGVKLKTKNKPKKNRAQLNLF